MRDGAELDLVVAISSPADLLWLSPHELIDGAGAEASA
jgi:hypothetical protein